MVYFIVLLKNTTDIIVLPKGIDKGKPLSGDLLNDEGFIIKSVSLGDCCSFIWLSEERLIEDYKEYRSEFFISKSKLVSIQKSEKRKEVLELFNKFLVKNKMMNQTSSLKFTYTMNLKENGEDYSLLIQELPFYGDLLSSFVIVTNTSYLKLRDSHVSVTNIHTGKFYPKIDLVNKEGNQLNQTEITVMALIMKGKDNKSIAYFCNRSEETVKSYRKTIIKKIGAKNMFEAITLFKTISK